MNRGVKNFDSFLKIYESEEYPEAQILSKIRRVMIWISINKGFYAELLSNLEISGSADINPKTMCTNGSRIIFHPEFVMNQSEEALRLVFAHELLHCIGDHCNPERIGSRNPQGWSIACDYAINPILQSESGFEFPVQKNGERMGLLEPKYDGWRPEDIYDDLIQQGQLDPNGASSIPVLIQASDFGQLVGEDDEITDNIIEGLSDVTGALGGEESGEGEEEGGEEEGGEEEGGEEEGGGGEGVEGEEEGESSDSKSKNKDNNTKVRVKPGDRVRLKDGTVGVVKTVNSDGSITI